MYNFNPCLTTRFLPVPSAFNMESATNVLYLDACTIWRNLSARGVSEKENALAIARDAQRTTNEQNETHSRSRQNHGARSVKVNMNVASWTHFAIHGVAAWRRIVEASKKNELKQTIVVVLCGIFCAAILKPNALLIDDSVHVSHTVWGKTAWALSVSILAHEVYLI